MVLVVIPAFNEEKKVGRVIRGLFEHGYNDIVVVDDGSKDRTSDEAIKAGAKVLKHEINLGQGAALETGDEYARMLSADCVVHFDADGQFDPADIGTALKILEEKNLDVVLGSRFIDDRSKIPWFKKYVLLRIARWINFVFTGTLLTDAHNGFRIFNQNALQKIYIKQNRMAHNTEILGYIKKHQLKYQEVPVLVTYDRYGQGVYGGFKIIYELLIGLFTK